MTDADARAVVREEMSLADSALQAAEQLLNARLPPDAASRCYYAAFHAARALLLSVGVEAHSHRALRTLLSLHFVKDGALDPERSKDLAQLEGLRQSSDYDSSFTLGVDNVRPELGKARAFVEDARRLLIAGGWLD